MVKNSDLKMINFVKTSDYWFKIDIKLSHERFLGKRIKLMY